MAVSSAAGREVCCRPSGPNNRSWNCCPSGRPPAFSAIRPEQRVIGVAVLVGGVGREMRRMPERDGQYLLRCPDLPRVGVQDGRQLGRGRVAVEPAAHLQQLGDSDVLAVRHIGDVDRYRVAEPELAVLGKQHDQRRRHGLGVRSDPEMGVRVRRGLRAQLCGADHRLEVPLRGAQQHHRPGDHQLLGGCVDDGLKCGRIDGLQR